MSWLAIEIPASANLWDGEKHDVKIEWEDGQHHMFMDGTLVATPPPGSHQPNCRPRACVCEEENRCHDYP